ncbi:MAG: MBL fold metallo-hydrolase [Elusimicrobiota bacterium]|nr:MBL fold metallo-hydrolase [Elusimicrobiota bacterium]
MSRRDALRLSFHGGVGEVTGSRHLLEAGGRKVLLDCGLFQGHRREALAKNRDLTFDPRALDAVLLSHAHIDHSGGLPILAKKGFRGPIYATAATADLCGIMLMDSARLQEEDAKFFNKIHAGNTERIEPLYGEADAQAALSLLRARNYGDEFEPAPGLKARFHDAGHVLGSAMISVDAPVGAHKRRVLFSGDLGRRESLIMRPPGVPKAVDYLVIESTYGGRRHEPIVDAQTRLGEIVKRTLEEKGRLLIPSFALERTQEILFLLRRLKRAGALPSFPLYLDSPMGAEITDIFHKRPEYFRPSVDHDPDPFGLEDLRVLRTPAQSKSLNERPGPLVIVSSSGMCEGGRILHHLRNSIGRDDTTVLIVGYQAEGTLGRRLFDGAKKVKIFGLEHSVWARVEALQSLSAHADGDDLVWFIKSLEPRPRKVFLVHGGHENREALAARLKSEGVERVESPGLGDAFDLD